MLEGEKFWGFQQWAVEEYIDLSVAEICIGTH